jgi:hypothetical protein
LGRFELRMPEKLLDLLEGHPLFQQRRRHRVTQQMRMDALGDARQRRRCLDELLDTPWGIPCVARGCKQRPRRAIPQRRPEFVRECWQQRDLDVHFVNTLPVRGVPGGLGHARVGGHPGGARQGCWMPAFVGMTFSSLCTGA